MPRNTALTTHLRAPSYGLLATEPLRAVLDFCAAKLAEKPKGVGDGHSVIVYPGLGGGPLTTSHLRSYLADGGFDAHDWGGGINTGPSGEFDDWLGGWSQRVRELHAREGRKVSLVGWSLGGVYAREIARTCPDAVRQVITLGTPFAALGDANHAGTLFRLLGGDTSQLTPEMQDRLRDRLPVPTTSVYSKSDGVVSWRGCLLEEQGPAQNIEVNASHLGMAAHPDVLRIVLDRLLVPEGRWSPYRGRRRVAAALRAATARGRSTR